MAVYEYIAKDCEGNKFSGVYSDVQSKEMLKHGLEKMGYDLVRAKLKKRCQFQAEALCKQITGHILCFRVVRNVFGRTAYPQVPSDNRDATGTFRL